VGRHDHAGAGRVGEKVGKAGNGHRSGPAMQDDDRAAAAALVRAERYVAE